MDHSYPYIASLTREPFLFYEMRSTAKLMSEGLSDEAIVTEIVEQNLFQYPTEKSITRMAKACIKRLHALEDKTLVSAIASQPTEIAKQICGLWCRNIGRKLEIHCRRSGRQSSARGCHSELFVE